MGNLMNSLKKFVSNKNTVTILGVLLGIVVLYFGYNYRVNQKVKFVEVLYAKKTIPSNTQITSDMIGTIKVNSELTRNSKNIVTSIRDITDKEGNLFYVNFDSQIPTGGLIYKDLVVSKAEKTDQKLYSIPDGYRYFTFNVDLSSTLGNSIAPGNSVDIYMYVESDGTKRFGKLYSNIEVLDVVDNKWTTTAGSNEKKPDLLLVMVSEEDYRLLQKTTRISGVELVPAPNNVAYDKIEQETEISSYDLQYFIESQYIAIAE